MSIEQRRRLVLAGLVSGCMLIGLQVFAGAKAPLSASGPQAVAARIAPRGMYAPPRGDVRLVVISDLNSQYGSTSYEPQVDRAVALIPGWQPDIVLCGGDMVAGQSPSLKREKIQAMWAAFDRHIGAPLRKARLPYGFTIGNHDASSEQAFRGGFLYRQERELAAAHWNNSQHDPGVKFIDRAGFPFYYTFEQNDIFYLVWDASSARMPAAQLAWVEKSLASKAAQAAKLRIAIGHLPLYAVAVGRDEAGEVLDNADQLREMLERYRVHTYISGHHHAYFPGRRNTLEMLHTGALGSGPRPLLEGSLVPWHTLSVVDVNLQSQSTVYTTYDMKTLKVIDQRQLPRMMVGPNGMVLRRDVQWRDLSRAEQSVCRERLGDERCHS